MIYFDNAATTFPKPEAVYRESARFARTLCGNPGRSAHRLSAASARAVYACREEIASLLDGSPECVVFTPNATAALNLAIRAFARPGSHILISGLEHNAVLRPVAALPGCRYDLFDPRGGEEEILNSLRSRMTEKTSLVVCCHVSNLCGMTLPVEKIGALCEKAGVRFVADASQSAGSRPLSLAACRADALCAPGHKGLYGLQGSGFALFSDRYRDSAGELPPFLYGGNGVDSESPSMPAFLPERFEAGTLPTPAIVGLREGIRAVREIGVSAIGEQEAFLAERLKEMLRQTRGITLYAGEYPGNTVLFNAEGIPSERLAEGLDREGICVRAGLHCCPLGHRLLETGGSGAVRVSFSIFNRKREVEDFMKILGAVRKRLGGA